MRKVVVFTLMMCMSILLLTGCNSAEAEGTGTESVSAEADHNSAESDTNAKDNSFDDAVTEGDSVQTEEHVEEIMADMTVEEKIAYLMPAKLELGEDEIYTPEPVTAEMIMAKMEEITISEERVYDYISAEQLSNIGKTAAEKTEQINKENLAGLLVLNASCMNPAEFNQLVTEEFGSIDELVYHFYNYMGYLFANGGNDAYGEGSSVVPEKLVYDPYLKNQTEQISCMIRLYQGADGDSSKVYYDILMNYLFYDANEYMTFNHDDTRLEGPFLPAIGTIVIGALIDDIVLYDVDLYMSAVPSGEIDKLNAAVEEYAN